MKTVKFKTNINCGGCIQAITPVLNDLDNIDFWKVDIDNADKVLEVNLDDENEKAVIEAVKNSGYEIEVIEG